METTGYALTDLPNEKDPTTATTTSAAEESGYRYADGEQILRSHQRDSEHVERLTELLTDVARNIQGELDGYRSRWVIARSNLLQVLSKLLYYGLTFGAASQTLGEEYVEILPYAAKRHNFPSRRRRLLSVLALSLIPSVWRSLITALQPAPAIRRPGQERETRRAALHRLLTSEAVKRLPEAWFVYFLLRSRNVDWSKSLFGLRYITSVPEKKGGSPTYEAVGVLLALPMLSKLMSGWRVRQAVQEVGADTGVQDKENQNTSPGHTYTIDSQPALALATSTTTAAQEHTILPLAQLTGPARPQCPLCLAPRGVAPESGGTCVTECGHVFCWGCIQEWGHEKVSIR
ncbi:hypothetical protein QFC21_004150 [Naganishia friedmannii]|uniref:Uncharacterized protein n=1 Tax=Naganishia friedmannii TaxID=89922 RepID=A0ACC2VJV2_9TREE|nr:hypothetical protein QFC21_004150 [Naganishia friedmannii]